MTDTHHPPIGLEALRAALKTVPGTPGIYKMIDGAGKILYIGKAKNLINRVTSYTNINNLNNRIMRMVAQIATVEVITTKNEAEALLVEASLIKRRADSRLLRYSARPSLRPPRHCGRYQGPLH
jgi:excinuclease ABC subunit C